LSRRFVADAGFPGGAPPPPPPPPRLLRRCKRNVIAQANEQPWPRLQGRFDYYPAAVEDAAETHRSEAVRDASASRSGDACDTSIPKYPAAVLR
jgi:hypothetical protein